MALKIRTADVNNQHGIQRRGQDFDKKNYLQSLWGKTRYFNLRKYQNV